MRGLAIIILSLVACEERAPAIAVQAQQNAAKTATRAAGADAAPSSFAHAKPTTDASIAFANLERQLQDVERKLTSAPDDLALRSELVELLELRLRFIHRFEDLERMIRLSELPAGVAPSPDALALRAKVEARLHRFAQAQAALDAAEKRGASKEALLETRAVIAIATGQGAALEPELTDRAEARPSLEAWVLAAAARAAAGQCEAADDAFAKALDAYGDLSPFPVAWIQFRRGVMWSEQCGLPDRGRVLYTEALRHVPSYAAAAVHLAELEADAGETVAAIRRLERVVSQAADPEALALLAHLLSEAGEVGRAAAMEEAAKQRLMLLLKRYPEAFADHGARFYLDRDPARARVLAEENAKLRPTPDALSLAARACRAAGDGAAACAHARRSRSEALVAAYCR